VVAIAAPKATTSGTHIFKCDESDMPVVIAVKRTITVVKNPSRRLRIGERRS
jgi:hypothetical protein